MTSRFEFLDHTADLGIRGTGATLGEAFAGAALGLFSHMTDPERVEARGEVEVHLEAGTGEDLLVAWLEELRFANESRLLVFARFEADVSRDATGWRLHGHAFGEDYDAARHGHIHEVKAITRHHLKVQAEPPLVEVILDI
ncbi:MAG TPA: archease [Candidatus Thermoplasmatota archaeon]|nr:archease [Candidatus Thermoplasmatota archaeon]